MPNKYEIDFQDSKMMWKFQMESLEVADQYAEARKQYAIALKKLKVGLATAYGNNQIEKKIAEDKAYLVLAEMDTEYKIALQNLIMFEGEYKGLEQVLQARSGALSFNQSLIKNQMKNA
jgi:hypothetical protein